MQTPKSKHLRKGEVLIKVAHHIYVEDERNCTYGAISLAPRANFTHAMRAFNCGNAAI